MPITRGFMATKQEKRFQFQWAKWLGINLLAHTSWVINESQILISCSNQLIRVLLFVKLVTCNLLFLTIYWQLWNHLLVLDYEKLKHANCSWCLDKCPTRRRLASLKLKLLHLNLSFDNKVFICNWLNGWGFANLLIIHG